MASEPCDGCGTEVNVAGGISAMWNYEHEPTGGMTLEFEDGTEHFLCFECVDTLPEYPTAEDVTTLGE